MRIIDKFNLTDPSNCNYYEADGKYYLVAPNNYFFLQMRLGDQTIMNNILYNIKVKLIDLYPNKFTQDNLYFLYNNDETKNLLVDINDLLKYSPCVFDQGFITQDKEEINKYHIKQIQPRFHNQKMNWLQRVNNQTLTDDLYPNVPLIAQNTMSYTGNKDKVLILPTGGKRYHLERNQSDSMIMNIIRTLPFKYKQIYIINKDVYKRDLNFLKDSNREVTILGNGYQWNQIVDIAVQQCNLYIGGDCGFSHLLGSMYNSPENITIFYRTKQSIDNWINNWFKYVVNVKEEEKAVIGIDDMIKIDQRIQSIYKRNVMFQSNQDGLYMKEGFYKYEQTI